MKRLANTTTDKRILTSLLLSFIWVKNYQYNYNVETFNTPIINIWAFTIWLIAGYLFLSIYDKVKKNLDNRYLIGPVSWCIYFIGLLVVEYLGYSVLGIHENSARGGALIFGLIHGNRMMHIYYLCFPILSVILYRALFIVAPIIMKWASYTNNLFHKNAIWR